MDSRSQKDDDAAQMNWLQRLQYSHPKTWATLAFIPFMVFTVVGFPISFIYDFCVDWWKEFKMLLEDIGQFHSRLWYDVKVNWQENFDIIRCAWKILLNSAMGNEPLCEQRKKKNGEQQHAGEES